MLRPLINDPASYLKEGLRVDLLAGLTVAILLVPQGMAYASLAGLPPIYGLYGAFIPALIYPIFSSSRHLAVGPVALMSIIILSGLSQFATPSSELFIELALLSALLTGIIQIILSFLKLGSLVNFLSYPVISGFTSAAALTIIISQLKYVFGLNIPRQESVIDTVVALFNASGAVQLEALAIGCIGIALILIAKKISKKIPSALIVVILGILTVHFTQWDLMGLPVVGDIPSGLPEFQLPSTSMENIRMVLPLALVLSMISFIQSMAISKTLASRHHETVDANKELMALGLSKAIGSLFMAYPGTGSFGRSAINESAGAKTGFSSILTALFIGLTLLFFTELFEKLPMAILAAIVITAVFGLIDVKEAKRLYSIHKRDFTVLIITFITTLLLGIQNGLLFGVVISLVFIIMKASKPHHAVLGKLEEHDVYRNVLRYESATRNERILILRYDDDIFFGNAEHFYQTVLEEIDARSKVDHLILDLISVSQIDSTGMRQFKLLIRTLDAKGIELLICSAKGPVRDRFEQFKVYELIGADRFHWDIDRAREAIELDGRKSAS